jgi:uncharacterized protein (TIGR02598 family)
VRSLIHRNAFSLVEVTLALGIASICLIAVFALLPIGISTNRNAIGQSIATDILSAVVSDLRATPNTTTTSPQFGINFDSSTTLYFDATGAVTATPTNQAYRLTVTFPTNSAGPNAAAFADLKISWPAPVDPATGTPSGSVEAFAAFDRH